MKTLDLKRSHLLVLLEQRGKSRYSDHLLNTAYGQSRTYTYRVRYTYTDT